MYMMSSRKGKVVIIDDDEDLTTELNSILTDANYEVEVCHSPQFVNQLVKKKPDVVLIDVWFEGTADGLNQTKALHLHQQLADVPIVLISSDPKLPDYASNLRVTAYLEKPLDPEKLLNTLDDITEATAIAI